jgi:hypothetical protein
MPGVMRGLNPSLKRFAYKQPCCRGITAGDSNQANIFHALENLLRVLGDDKAQGQVRNGCAGTHVVKNATA